jgi:hypothetical protein
MCPTMRALLVVILAFCLPGVAQAGMPSFNLTDVARMRVQTISFFLAGLLLSAWFVQLLWNYLRRDFVALPSLSYGKGLGLVVLWGLLFVLVLTMISGARELLTPGAWEKQGLTYRLKNDRAPPQPETRVEPMRWQRLARLRDALWNYARSHDGRFPVESAPEIPAEYWLASELSSTRYFYVAGQLADQKARPLVYEPEIYGDQRLVLLTNADIKTMTVEEVLDALHKEKP